MAYQSFYQFPYNQPNHSIQWVQGIAGAKAFPVGAGSNAVLMDSEESVFYIKSTDASGMPQPLRIFDYTERKEKEPEYVTREELQALLAKLGESDAEPTVSESE